MTSPIQAARRPISISTGQPLIPCKVIKLLTCRVSEASLVHETGGVVVLCFSESDMVLVVRMSFAAYGIGFDGR